MTTSQTLPVTIAPGIVLPAAVRQRFYNYQGRPVTDAWLIELPTALETWLRAWEIDLERVEPPDTVNLVLFGHSRRVGDIVLKLCPPTFESRAELAAVRQAAGPGFVRLIDADAEMSIIMLERVTPGTALCDAGLDDEAATRIGAAKIRDFWREPEGVSDLIPLERWARELLDHDPARHPDAPNDLLETAREMARDLLAAPTSRTMLHGDLHHQNILRHSQNGDAWITIDPKGLVGERGYDIATWMMNPWGIPHHDDYEEIGNRRLDIFVDMLGEPRARLAQWAVVHAALSLCWGLNVEQPEDPEGDVATLRSMIRLLG